MKTKLLYLASFTLVLFTACSVDETTNQLSEQEKDLKVKSFVETFIEDVKPSPNYKKFKEDVKFRSKDSTGLSQEELDQLEQDFLSKQSPEFVELYYFLVDLDLSRDELREIVVLYFESISVKNVNKSEEDNKECETAASAGNNSNIFWEILDQIICEVIKD